MEARRLLEEATFDPHQLQVIYKAFDDAWEELAKYVDSNPNAVQAARLKLATIVITLATNGMSADSELLAEKAIELMHDKPVAQ